MTTRIRHTATAGTAAAIAAFALLFAQAAAAQALAPLPSSAYTVRAACRAPSPGHPSCLALQLVPRTAAALAHTHPIGIANATAASGPSSAPSPAAGDFGLRPHDLHAAYDLPLDAETSSTQTIALVDAYNDPNAEADLEAYDTEFALSKCTTGNGCFTQVNEHGSGEASSLPFPKTDGELTSAEEACEAGEEQACSLVEEAQGWSVEMSLDIETAHAVCQNCHIALVEADEASSSDLDTAEEAAARLGADEISNSWGGPECGEGECERESPAFDHAGIVITVAAGDDGYLNWLEGPQFAFAGYPASLPQVVAVGGTRLNLGSGSRWDGETVWNDGGKVGERSDGYGAGGGGCSAQFAAQPWQRHVPDWASVGCASHRAVADVAADADPYTGLAVYDTSPECEYTYREGGTEHVLHWCPIGGTSLASPLIASVFALAGGSGGVRYPAQTLYQNAAKSPGSLHDVTEGSNGECDAPFDEGTFTTGCTQAEEARTSCASELICQAGAGYDGPTGVGTPDGIGAFELPAGGLSEESPLEEAGGGPGSGGGSTGGGSTGAGSGSSTSGGSTSPAGGATVTTSVTAQRVVLSGLALTLKALIALNTSRPKIADMAFTFTTNVTALVSVALDKRVGRRGHQRWQALTRPLTITALSGRDNHRLSGHGVLGSGAYRLTLTPVDGAARSIVFRIG